MKSNFLFLKDKYSELSECGMFAEKYLYFDTNTSIFKVGQFAEILVNYMMAYDNIKIPKANTHANRIKALKREGVIPSEIDDILYRIRKKRNDATHSYYKSETEALVLLEHAHTLAVWFMKVYGDYTYDAEAFIKPDSFLYDVDKLLRDNKVLEEKIGNLQSKYDLISEQYDKNISLQRLETGKKLSKQLKKSEKETRDLIDQQLRNAGWLADTENLRYSKGIRPEKNKNMAIAEWPTNSITSKGKRGAVDYVLFIGLELVGVIEAKKYKKDVPSVIDAQCKHYASNIRDKDFEYVIKKYNEYYVPFLFATNGRKYYKELPNQSGVWFLDVRKNTNMSKPLRNWFSPKDIKEMLDNNKYEGDENLKNDDSIYLTDRNGLNLRKYQVNAVKSVQQAIINGKTNILLSMATGTGKTRVALGIIYKLLRAKRFKRILFLVDRTALGEQAEDKFEEVKLEDFLNLNGIYGVNALNDKTVDMSNQVHILTVQSLVRKIIYRDEYSAGMNITPGNYDCIIVDEAHRGYTLEKEMDEDDILYRNQNDYLSKYRQVIEYFDAVKIGLTATPALHTTEIFGKAVFTYSYRQAVIDGYLVDHEPPIIIETDHNKNGITYEKGETLPILDSDTNEIINSDELEDEINFNVDKFNKSIITGSFNRTVLEKITDFIDLDGNEKTLIFAVNDRHADRIVTILREIYENVGINHRAIRKITGQAEDGNSDRVQSLIRAYKNDDYPNIAVTVDLLTTGVDIPRITNLVFMRRVKSRILFEQMLGRATRLCPDIRKTHFNIIDTVYVYDALEKLTNMKPVVTRTSMPMKALIDELDVVSDRKKAINIDQIIAKIHRKKNLLTEKDKIRIKMSNDGKGLDVIIDEIQNKGTKSSIEKIKHYRNTLLYIESLKNETYKYKVISDKQDTLLEVSRGYGETTKPEDYLESFEEFIKTNRDKIPALNLVCTKPTSLTRKDLKELVIQLDDNNFTEAKLQVAFKEAREVDIVADIISYIRAIALDIPIISHDIRIKKAIEKVKKNHDFNKMQLRWLDNIESTLLKENVLDMEMLDSGIFKSKGGGAIRLDKIFKNKLQQIVDEINIELYRKEG